MKKAVKHEAITKSITSHGQAVPNKPTSSSNGGSMKGTKTVKQIFQKRLINEKSCFGFIHSSNICKLQGTKRSLIK